MGTAVRSDVSDALTTLRRVGLMLLAAQVAVLAVTGVLLVFVYQPSSPDDGLALHTVVRALHRLASFAALPTALAAGILTALRASVDRGVRVAVGVGLVVATLAASYTGVLLPWDQLALRAVTVGTDIKGYTPLIGDEVRFVLLGGSEISKTTLISWLIVHCLVLGPAVAGLIAVAWRGRRVGFRRAAAAPPMIGG